MLLLTTLELLLEEKAGLELKRNVKINLPS